MKSLSMAFAMLGMALTPLAEAAVKNVVLVHGAFADGSSWRPVATILERAGPCVLVGHSWGGMIVTEVGDRPSVRSLAYVAAFEPDVGETAGALQERSPPAGGFAVIPQKDRQIDPDLERFMAGRAESETLEHPGSHVISLLHPKKVAALIEKAAQTAQSCVPGGPAIQFGELERSMSAVRVEQKSYQMPPLDGLSIAHFLTVADIERSARYYETVFGARILSLGDGNAPGYLQLANIWMILNVGGGPTPDKPTVTLSVPDPNHINSFMNFRVADIQACYQLWKSRGAEFITEPIPKYGEIRCYMRDPDGYIIEVGQSKPGFAYG
jgi:pimeloyl-ACP methyl ester carboxylesterase